MTNVQKCKQCGDVKSLTLFRKYYGNVKGHYRFCKDCEKLNQRLKYLRRKVDKTEAEVLEAQQIESLHDLQRSIGLEPPRKRADGETDKSYTQSLIERQMEAAKAKQKFEVEMSDETPPELLRWLNEELSAYHPDELEKTMDRLVDTYRPQTGLDDDMNIQYDERHRDILNKIQDRFDAHEEEFY